MVERVRRTQRASAGKDRLVHKRKKSKNRTLERSSGRDSYSCKDHTMWTEAAETIECHQAPRNSAKL